MDGKSSEISQKQNEANLPQMQPHPTRATLATQRAYDEIMGSLLASQQDQLLQQIIDGLSPKSIRYDPKHKGMGLHVKISEYTLNWQAMILQVEYGALITSLNILNLSDKSSHHRLTECYSGNFATTYRCNLHTRDVAIKCLPILNFEQDFLCVLKEYLLLMVASCLECGPAIDNPYGFHILVYPDCIEFSMEFCDSRLPHPNQLLFGLKKLHALGIMHCDIKPSNVSYSHVYKCAVFIDFGLSVLVGQAKGELTRTHFKGPLQFCSPEMKECYIESSPRMVDMYYNDAHALKKTIQKIQQAKLTQLQLDHNEEGFAQGLGKLIYEQNIGLLCKFHIFFSRFKGNRMELKQILGQMGYRLPPIRPILLNFVESLQNKCQFEQIRVLFEGCNRQIQRQNYRFAKQLHLYRQNSVSNQESGFKMRYRDIQEPLLEGQYQQTPALRIKLLLNYEQSQKCDMEMYMISIAEIVQLNSFFYDFDTKWNVCKIMKKLYMPQKPQEKADIEVCLIYLFDYASSSPVTKKKVIVLTRILLSVIILELKDQKELLLALDKVLKENIELSYVLKLILTFVSSIEWIQAKYKTSYQAASLQSGIVTLSQKALAQKISKNPNEIDCYLCNCLLFVLSLCKSILKIPLVCHMREQMHKMAHRLNQSEFKLIEQIEVYLLHALSEFCYQSQQQHIVHDYVIHSLERYVERYNKSSFEYYYFLIFKYYRSQKRNTVAEVLNQNLKTLLQPFHSAYVYKMDVEQRFQLFRMGQLSYHEFMSFIIKISTNCNQDYRIYIADYFTMMLSTSPYVFEIKQVISRRPDFAEEQDQNNRYMKELQYCKSVIFHNYKYQEGIGKHKHTIIEELSILKKIFVLYYCKIAVYEYNQQVLIKFFAKIKDILKKVDCFECKAISMFDMIPVRIININCSSFQLQSLWNLYLDTLIFCLHQRKTRYFVMYYATLLTSLYIQRPLQFMNFNPFLLYHYCVKTLNTYSEYLIQISQKMFIQIYNYFYHISDSDQLYFLINQLLLLLKERISHLFSTKFYTYVRHFINLVMQIPQQRLFVFEKHKEIISRLMKESNEYVGLYFSALMPSILQKQSGRPLILKICSSLNSLDPQSKQLILSGFYHQLIQLYEPSSRQKIFWQRKHQKHANRKRRTIKICSKFTNLQQKAALAKALKIYHQNAGSTK